jgi:hypothetical protein
MPEKNKNLFGHPTVAKPAGMPNNERLAQMANMLREDPEAELPPVEDPSVMSTSDLEQLIYLGSIEDSKTVSGFQFDVRTLTGKEQNDVWMSVSFLNGDTKFFVIKVALLSRAIVAVNGRNLDVLYKGRDFRELTKEQRCIKVVESWQQPLIDELYEFYTELLERSRKAIKPDDIKK